MSDIIERLRQFAAFGDTPDCRIMAQLALTKIEQLEAELASCRACREKIDCLSRGAGS